MLLRPDVKHFWDNLGGTNKAKLLKTIKSSLIQTFQEQNLLDPLCDNRDPQEGSKLRTYRKFKIKSNLEHTYLPHFHNIDARKNFTCFRISAHNLFIEMKKTQSEPIKPTPLKSRICQNCDTNSIEDEQHVLMIQYVVNMTKYARN